MARTFPLMRVYETRCSHPSNGLVLTYLTHTARAANLALGVTGLGLALLIVALAYRGFVPTKTPISVSAMYSGTATIGAAIPALRSAVCSRNASALMLLASCTRTNIPSLSRVGASWLMPVGDHPASKNAFASSWAYTHASVFGRHATSIDRGLTRNVLAMIARCAAVKWRSATRCWSSSRASSAFAARSRCVAASTPSCAGNAFALPAFALASPILTSLSLSSLASLSSLSRSSARSCSSLNDMSFHWTTESSLLRRKVTHWPNRRPTAETTAIAVKMRVNLFHQSTSESRRLTSCRSCGIVSKFSPFEIVALSVIACGCVLILVIAGLTVSDRYRNRKQHARTDHRSGTGEA